jgi:hypothetical protein
VVTVGPAVTLAFTVDELVTLLADDSRLVAGVFATIAGAAGTGAEGLERTGAADQLERFALDGVAPGEKLVALEHVPLFSGVSADDARALADLTRTVPLDAGSPLFAATATPGIWIVLSGRLALDSPGAARVVAVPGDVVGTVATLAGSALERAGSALTPGMALRVERDDLVALWAERPTLLHRLLSNALTALQRSESASAPAGAHEATPVGAIA